MVLTAPEWMADARCATDGDLDWFDLGCGLDELVALCHVCPVRTKCLAYAQANEITEGVWGGLFGARLEDAVTNAPGRGILEARGQGQGWG